MCFCKQKAYKIMQVLEYPRPIHQERFYKKNPEKAMGENVAHVNK